MKVEKVFADAFSTLKEKPLLLGVKFAGSFLITLITLGLAFAFLGSAALQVLSSPDEATARSLLEPFFSDMGVMGAVLVIVAMLAVVIAAVLMDSLTSLMVLHGANAGRKTLNWRSLMKSALPRVLPLMWTELLYGLAVAGAFLAIAAVIALASLVNPLLGVGVAVFAILGGFIAFAYAGLRLYTLAPVVAFENLSGWKAIQRSYTLGEGNVFNAFIAVLVTTLIGTSVGVAETGLNLIPVLGLLLSWALNVAFATFVLVLLASFYSAVKK